MDEQTSNKEIMDQDQKIVVISRGRDGLDAEKLYILRIYVRKLE